MGLFNLFKLKKSTKKELTKTSGELKKNNNDIAALDAEIAGLKNGIGKNKLPNSAKKGPGGAGNTWEKEFNKELEHVKKAEEASKNAKAKKENAPFYYAVSEIRKEYAKQLEANPTIAKRLTDVQSNPGENAMLQLSEIVASLTNEHNEITGKNQAQAAGGGGYKRRKGFHFNVENYIKKEGARAQNQIKEAEPQVARRPWEISKADASGHSLNPDNVKEIRETQERIQNAKTAVEAYKVFAEFTGNKNARVVKFDENTKQFVNWDVDDVDLDRFKTKLYHMTRMVYDYPELKGRIGNLVEKDNNYDGMSVNMPVSDDLNKKWGDLGKPAWGLSDKEKQIKLGVSNVNYSTYWDTKGDEKGSKGRQIRENLNAKIYKEGGEKKGYFSTHLGFMGNHELGHVLNGVLVINKNKGKDKAEMRNIVDAVNKKDTAYKIMNMAIKRSISDAEYANLDKDAKGKLTGNDFKEKGLSSIYGSSNAAEFWAEAFADVYQNGAGARKTSIELLKIYEQLRHKYGIV